jgi:transposase
MFEVREVLRIWLGGRGVRAVARMVAVDRKTVTRIVDVAVGLGLIGDGGEAQLDDVFVGKVVEALRQVRPDRHGDAWALIEARHDKVKAWAGSGVPVVKMCELLARERVVVPERTLHRYVAEHFGETGPKATVRVADGEPGVELQVDFGELGMMADSVSGKRRKVSALVFTAAFSRHCFVWLAFGQTLDVVIAGFEAAWTFFGGVFRVVIPDNMRTVVTHADGCDPTFNQAFVEYAQSRGFLIDPARVRAPQDKGRVERNVAFVQSSFWAGETFTDLVEAQAAAELWCRTRAGMRTHGSTRRVPVEVFDAEEAPRLSAVPVSRYDLPIYRDAKVARDYHVQVAKALYSVPEHLIGSQVAVKADTALVKIYSRGVLVKTHVRLPPGGRSTDPADLPSHKTAYAMRDINRLVANAAAHGDAVAELAAKLVDHPLPWTRMRKVYRLFGLCRTYGDERTNEACRRMLDAEAADVGVVARMLERALEAERTAAEPTPPRSNVIVGRFARDKSHFDVTKARP